MKKDATRKGTICGCTTLAITGLSVALTSGVAMGAAKKVIIEDLTATWCGYCPPVGQGLSMLIDDYPDRIVGLQVHTGGDPYETQWTQSRELFYGQSGWPDVWVDGLLEQPGSAGTATQNYNSMRNMVNQRPATTDVTGTLSS